MSSASRRDTRKILMRTAATALIAASPFVYSGASAATTASSVQLTAPTLQDGKVAKQQQAYSLASASAASGNFQLNAPVLQAGKIANDSLLFASNFNLSAPALQGASNFAAPRLASQPVQNLLAVPMDAQAGAATISASAFSISTASITPAPGTTTVNNSDDLTVTDAETAIDVDGGQNHVVINNTGDLTGGGGINVETGKFDPATASASTTYRGGYYHLERQYLYYADDHPTKAGEPVMGACYAGSDYQCKVTAVTDIVYSKVYIHGLDADQTDAAITINNSGNVKFSGIYGIRAKNEAGASVDINNSGDIISTEDTDRRVGISADTTVDFDSTYTDTGYIETVARDAEYNSDGHLTGVNTIGQYQRDFIVTTPVNDVGAITIKNAGLIDMGDVDVSHLYDGFRPAYAVSEGIFAYGFGHIDIANQAGGTIKVGDFSNGIHVISGGDLTVRNDGAIELGNWSNGIQFDGVAQGDELYSAGGDALIINTGDISGGMTKAEAAASVNYGQFKSIATNVVNGISIDMLGTNRDGYGWMPKSVEVYQGYGFDVGLEDFGDALPDPYWQPGDQPKVKNFTAIAINTGNIDLKDGGIGIRGSAVYGEIRAYNAGTISVGEGQSSTQDNRSAQSGGIILSNFGVAFNGVSPGSSDLFAMNEAGGIIVTGDDGVGIAVESARGLATAVNYGSIQVGNGVIGDHTYGQYSENPVTYDWVIQSIGMSVWTNGGGMGQTAIALNGQYGTITTGDLSVGISVIGDAGLSRFLLMPYRTTAQLVNEGEVATGDNSAGLYARGNNVLVKNTGSVTIGDKDLSGLVLVRPGNDTNTSVHELQRTGHGIYAKSDLFGMVENTGSVTTGNGTAIDRVTGIFNGMSQDAYGIATYTIQGETGIVSTGDYSTGIKSFGTRLAYLGNAGTVSVGNDSVGVDMTSGRTAYLRIGTDRANPDALVKVVGSVQATNSGLIETGDNSTGIRLNAVAEDVAYSGYSFYFDNFNHKWPPAEYNYYSGTTDILGSVLLDNTGTIRVGANSTAVEISGKGLKNPIANPDYDPENPIAQPWIPNPNHDPQVNGSQPYLPNPVYDRDSLIAQPYLRNPDYDPSDPNSEPYLTTDALPQLFNTGTIDAGQGIAIKANVGNGIDTIVFNGGTIIGDILFGDGDDLLYHAQDIDFATGQVLGTGNIIMNGNTINFGGGENRFVIDRGVISVAGDGPDGEKNLITGDNLTVEMNYGEIDARNDFIVYPASPAAAKLAAVPFADPSWFSTLTIDADVSGNFHFAADVDAAGNSDKLIINGDVLPDSEIGVIINPVEQLKGEVEWRPITIKGTNDAELIELFNVTGLYADSFLGGEAVYDAATGDIVINATFGMGHMATATNAAAISAQNWLGGTLSSYGNRNIHAYTGRKGEGLAVWGYAFQDEGRIQPGSDLQDLSFSEISTGMQAGVQWSQDIAGGRVSVSPMFTYGTVEANLHANRSSSRGHPWAVGLNANYVTDGGIYVDATYQHMSMDVDLKTPQTPTQATGEGKIKGQGFNLEAGYAYNFSSGLVLEPQLQLTHVKVDMDDFASSDDIYELSDIDGKSTTLRAGVSVYKVFETSNGSITPLASLSYLNALNGKTQLASNGVDFDSDTTGSGYKAEIGLLGRYHSWDFAGKLGVSNTSATGSIIHPSLTVRYGFGGAAKATAKSAAVPQLPEVTEATVKFAEAGNVSMAPLATAASAEDGAKVVSAAYAQTGAEPTEATEKKEEQPQQSSPELEGQPAPENPMDPDAEPAADEEADEVTDITVTGSLIRRSTATEATPITVVTSEDMAERGLMTLGEVMQSFTQNEGFVQGKASNLLGRFTFGAEEINFRGLGAGRTLVLVNGRRIADYPLPFGGEQNGVDLGTIPYSAIAKVEYLSAGASATYGSDAVGGVVNIITKRDMEQTALELTGGLYQQGFGETGRIAAITGNSFDRGSFTIGAEGYYSGEIVAGDSKYFRKHAPFNAAMIDILDTANGGQSSVVPQTACEPLGFEFDTGQCTSNVSDTISLSPKTKQGSAFFDGRYDLTDRIELFGTAMASIGQSESRSNVLFWRGVVVDVGADGVIGDPDGENGPGVADDGEAKFITRGFSEDELGISTVTVDNNMWTVVAGAKGGIDVGNDTWYWDVAASHASFHTKQTSMNLKEEGVRNWLLDGAETAIDFTGQRYTYFVDSDFYNNQLVNNAVRPVQPADVDALRGENVMKANSSAQSLTATLNGTLGDLGFLFKPVKFAVRAEYGRQVTEINPDDRTLNTTGEGWFNIGAIEAKGKRNRWALAAEADASVLSNLDLVLGLRYDHYDDDSSITGRFTSQAKFIYRPTDWLKVRGGYGQTFRAPDMFNIYGRSDGFEIVPDFSAPGCFDGSTYVCGGYQIASSRVADPGLKEEHGDDLGLGVIVNPLPGFQFTVDWYNIHLKDLVLTESAYELVLKEWQCDNEVLDTNSALCADVRNRVIRNDIDGLERVIVQPINQSNLTRSGIDIQASYSFESAKLGSFNFNLGYSRTLKFELTRFKGDDSIDLKYGEPGSATPGNNLNFGVNWYQPLTTGKGIAAGLFVQRTGRVYNFDQSQFLEPFYDVNLSAAYQLNTKTSFRLNVNNVLNTKPQENGSGFWPGYWAHLQTANALGRSAYVSLNYSFN